jgi:hypothetical protein
VCEVHYCRVGPQIFVFEEWPDLKVFSLGSAVTCLMPHLVRLEVDLQHLLPVSQGNPGWSGFHFNLL